jgi:inhibitor of KinA
LLVEFGNAIRDDLNEAALALCGYLERNPFAGFIEAVPAYASAAVIYDPVKARRAANAGGDVFEFVREEVTRALAIARSSPATPREIKITCRFGGGDGPDLGEVAERAGLTESEVIKLFAARTYRVYMLGFLPGFSYMGEVDERIAAPRRAVPRVLVPKGSIGIAGRQTGIYSLDSPGGWQIIARTDMPMFLPKQQPPSYLMPGDRVRFEPR